MGYTKLAIYLVGLVIVVTAAWVFLTQTGVAASIPGGVAIALILLLVGVGVMAGARSVDDRVERRRVTYDGPTAPPPVAPRTERVTTYEEPVVRSGTVTEERRFE